MNKVFLELWAVIPWQYVWAGVGVFVSIVVGLYLKGWADRFVAFYQFDSNPDLGLRVRVGLGGQFGKIESYNKKWIYVRMDDKSLRLVHMTKWLNEKWTVDIGDKKDELG